MLYVFSPCAAAKQFVTSLNSSSVVLLMASSRRTAPDTTTSPRGSFRLLGSVVGEGRYHFHHRSVSVIILNEMKMKLVPNSGRLHVVYTPQTTEIFHIKMVKIFRRCLEGRGEIMISVVRVVDA